MLVFFPQSVTGSLLKLGGGCWVCDASSGADGAAAPVSLRLVMDEHSVSHRWWG